MNKIIPYWHHSVKEIPKIKWDKLIQRYDATFYHWNWLAALQSISICPDSNGIRERGSMVTINVLRHPLFQRIILAFLVDSQEAGYRAATLENREAFRKRINPRA